VGEAAREGIDLRLPARSSGPGSSPRLLPAFAGAGLAATAAQVLLLRELLVSASGDEASIAVGYAAWFLGIALGAAARRRLAAARALPAGALVALLAASAGAGIVLLRLLRAAAAPPPGELPGLGLVLLLAAAALLPSGSLVGASFAALGAFAATLLPPGAALARLYVVESLGSLGAGVGASLLVGTLLAPFPASLLAGLLASLLLAAARVPGRRAAVAAAAALAIALLVAPPVDLATEELRFRALSPASPLVAVADTPHAHLLLGGGGPLELWENGAFASSFPDPHSSETYAHLAVSLAASPRRVLALGPVERGPLRFLLPHGVERLDLVVPDPRALAFVAGRLPPEDVRALRDRRVRVVEDDPRRFLARSREAWDLVLLDGPDPVTLARARLLTAETFGAVAARLDRRGALVVPLRTAPASLAGDTAALAGSVFGALRAAFPVVLATPGPDTLFVAGFDPEAVTLDPGVLSSRFRTRGVTSDAFAPELFPILLEPANVARLASSLGAAARDAPPSRDDRPVSLLHALARRQDETASPAGRALGALARLPAPLLAALVLLPSSALAARSLAARAPLRRAALHGVVATGAGSLAVSFLLLLSYQEREGALYGALGALTAAFLAGLATGAGAARRLLAPPPLSPRALPAALALASLVFGAAALAPDALSALPSLPSAVVLAAHAAFLLAAGAATGAVFPAATDVLLATGADGGASAALFETADHLGAAAAALLAGVVLVPALGMRATGLLAGAVVLLAALDAARAR